MRTNIRSQPDYMPQLDSLRFFAVLGVLVSHYWIPQGLPWLMADMDWGWIGVHLFFVLSGFLITGILLDCRQMAEASSQPLLFYVRQFYVRRFLRIFPIYYLVIGIAIVWNFPQARELWGWLVSYTANIYITVQNSWIGLFSHFWSLAVEEQFYLFWPWVILFFPRKWMPILLSIMILLAPAYRLYGYEMHRFDVSPFDFKSATLTLANFDSLGLGALLALAQRSKTRWETVQRYLSRIVLPTGLLVWLTSLTLYHYRIKPSVFFSMNDLALSLIFTWLVAATAIGFKGTLGKLLALSPIKYMGKISYGIYVYHYFIPFLIGPIFRSLNFQFDTPGFIHFIVSSVITIAVASLSWYVFELPINNLKRYFSYKATNNTVHQPTDELMLGSKENIL